jgi:hypothetical protein
MIGATDRRSSFLMIGAAALSLQRIADQST